MERQAAQVAEYEHQAADVAHQRAAELERASAASVARAAQSHHPSVLQFTVCASKCVARNICDMTLCYRSASASQN